MKKAVILCFVFISIVVAIIYTKNLDLGFNQKASEKSSKIHKVQLSKIEDVITMKGIVAPKRETSIIAYYKGYIKRLYVKHGDYVKRYDPLVTVEESLIIDRHSNPIRAPYDGTITLINKAEGQQVDVSDVEKNFILKIEDLSKIYLHASATEYDINKIKHQQNATMKFNSVLDKTYHGVIQDIAWSSQKENDNRGSNKSIFLVTILIEDPDIQLHSGMNGLADILVQAKENVIVIPNEFLHQGQEKTYVKLKNGIEKDVKIGLINAFSVEITEGLNVGEEIQAVNYFQE